MKAGWQTQPLGEVLRLEYGKPLEATDRKPDGLYPVYGANGEKDRTDSFYHSQPSIIVGRKGSAGEINLTEERFWPLDVTYYVTYDNQRHDLQFLYYLLTTLELPTLAKGVKPGINRNDVYAIKVKVPPLPEQHRIVAILDEAFDGIATAKANAEKNLQNAKALFESHLQSVFTERGEGWIEASIGNICTLKSGTSVSVSLERSEGEIPYVKVSDMTYPGNEKEIIASSRYLDLEDIGKNATFPTGSTIFPKRGGAILTNKKRLTALPICADLNIMGVIPPSNLLPKLLYFFFLNVDMRLIGSGSSIPQINNYDIAPLKISFPESLRQQELVVQKLECLADETHSLESIYKQKLTALDELKKSLLHQAFSGEL